MPGAHCAGNIFTAVAVRVRSPRKEPGERIADFATRVKQLAVACKFTVGERQARLKDRFISGLQDSEMVSAILRLKDEDITFETASAVAWTLRDVLASA